MAMTATDHSRVLRGRRACSQVVLTSWWEDELAEIARPLRRGGLGGIARTNIILDARLTEANGTAERTTALDTIDDKAHPGSTVGADKNYDTAEFRCRAP